MWAVNRLLEPEVQEIVAKIKLASERGEKSVTVQTSGDVAAVFVNMHFKVSFQDDGKITIDWS
jgi:anti-anti-sigma regulatory factor